MKDSVSVIGAGTAGLIAAKRLAQLGVETTVYDQKKVLGHPVRASGILSIRGLDGLGIDYGRAVTNTLHGARIHSGGETMEIRAGAPVAKVLDRKLLNDLCHDEAVANGANVMLGSRVAGHALEALSEANIVVGADGAVSEVAKHFRMGDIGRYAVTYKAEYNIRHDDPGLVDLFFDPGVSRGLFAWFCPNAEDILEIGIGVDSKAGNAKASFQKFLSLPRVYSVIGSSRPVSEGASIIPLALRTKIVDNDRGIVLVGDAAGQVKPSTGGGIIYGGNASLMAARSIKNHIEGNASLEEYRKAYMRKYSLDTRLHAFANWIYSRAGEKEFGFALRVLRGLGVGSFLGRYGDMDMPSSILRNLLLGITFA